MEYQVEVELRATVRVTAQCEEDALDAADRHIDAGGHFEVHSATALCATEV